MKRLFDEHRKRETKSLDGAWRFCLDREDVGEQEQWFLRQLKGETVTVPGVWNMQFGLLQYEGVAWYQREFYTEGGALRFCFGAVMTQAKVYLDGKLLGGHYGGFCEFELLARSVQAGEHTLTVRVDNRFDLHSIPQKKVDWYHYGGITRSVTVERLQGICALYHRLDYELSADLTAATCRSTVELYNAAEQKATTRVRIFIENVTVFEQEITLEAGEARTVLTPDKVLSDIRLWDQNAPRLYDACVLTDTDDLWDRVGFRFVEAREGRIYLNGREIELLGINRHEDHPDWGMAFPQGLMKHDLDIAVDMGCNTLRGSHYPNSREFLDLLDERGILFWSEIPIWGCGFAPETLADPVVIARGLEMHREMVRYYCNHPSIILWGMHNEIRTDLPESMEMSKQYYTYLKENGGNRLVTFASNMVMDTVCYEYCDVISLNVYIGWYGSRPLEEWAAFLDRFRAKRAELGMEEKPVIMSEFGGAAIYGHHTFDDLKGTEEYQAKLLSYCLNLFHADPMVAGTYIWQFCDIRTAPQMGLDRARGYNNKGVLNEYRRPKASYRAVKELYHGFRSMEEKK